MSNVVVDYDGKKSWNRSGGAGSRKKEGKIKFRSRFVEYDGTNFSLLSSCIVNIKWNVAAFFLYSHISRCSKETANFATIIIIYICLTKKLCCIKFILLYSHPRDFEKKVSNFFSCKVRTKETFVHSQQICLKTFSILKYMKKQIGSQFLAKRETFLRILFPLSALEQVLHTKIDFTYRSKITKNFWHFNFESFFFSLIYKVASVKFHANSFFFHLMILSYYIQLTSINRQQIRFFFTCANTFFISAQSEA